ncbi:MAG: gamma-glutamyltransferase [Gemmatimonadetes bacterium]|nr:gamma-glutamyltransferase [Gemmatimonadota bacterium]
MTGRRNIFLVFSALGLFVFGGWSMGSTGPETLLSSTFDAQSQQNVSAVRAPHGMVVSATKIASEAGAQVLRAGGNAVDAAIATGFALAVTSPSNGNIGGGGFMVIRFPNGSTTAIDFREKAPLASFPEMWLEDGEYSSQKHHQSHWAVGVPGTVAGFWKAHQLYGHGEWSGLVDPAIGLASDGFPISESLARGLRGLIEGRGSRHPGTMKSFAKNGTEAYEQDEILKQPDLALSLGRIAVDGHDGFYSGETAELLVAEMERAGGLITMEDLQRYQARERTPVHGSYRGYDVISMPPPSSGGIAIVQMLNILEGFDLNEMGHNSADYIHHLTEAMRRAYRDRATYLADQDFADVPLHRLTSKDYAAELRVGIDPTTASVSQTSDIALGYESPETTHYSVVDAQGMAVSVTYTLEAGYGSAITVPGGGFLLNNEMGDFNAGPGITTERGLIGTRPNLARPEQRMLSSMSPSIVAKDGELVAVIGSPGGRTIINTVLQLILNIVDFDHGIQEAVNAPRIHHQWLPGSVRIEQPGATDEILATLRAMGHEVTTGRGQGRAHSIMVDPDTGDRLGAADPRGADSGASGH